MNAAHANPFVTVSPAAILRAFPSAVAARTMTPAAEALIAALYATSKVRFGPAPSPMNDASIRVVVDRAIRDNEPLNVLMPWGSKKPDNGTIDVAELGALKTLAAFAERVKEVHAPGVVVRMRIEDTSGDYLFREEGPEALVASAHYVEEFMKLLRIMDLPFIVPRRERDMMDARSYGLLADELRPAFREFIEQTDALGIVDDPSMKTYQVLEKLGWKGFIPWEQRDFYRSRYARQGLDLEGQTDRLAGYLASILARVKMGGYGSEDWGKNFVNLSFAPPVPGTPAAFAERRVFYRTLPESMTRTHIPPWRARGYLKVNSADDVAIKLATTEERLDLFPNVLQLTNRGETVAVRAHLLAGAGHVGAL